MHLSISSVHTLDCRGLSLQAKCQVLGTCWAARDVRSCHLGTYKRHRGRGGEEGNRTRQREECHRERGYSCFSGVREGLFEGSPFGEVGVGREAMRQFKEHWTWRTVSDLSNQLRDLGEVTYSEDALFLSVKWE